MLKIIHTIKETILSIPSRKRSRKRKQAIPICVCAYIYILLQYINSYNLSGLETKLQKMILVEAKLNYKMGKETAP